MANIKDIAGHAGVSIATVSRALSNPEIVRPLTLKKVEEAIAALNYRPNMLASGLRLQRSNNIIVAVPSIFNPFASAFVQGIENVAREAGYRVLLGITESNQMILDGFVDMIASKQADGLILLDAILPKCIDPELEPTETPPPIVAAYEYDDRLTVPRVRIDDVEASALGVAHLIKLGHSRLAAITGPLDQRMARDRLAGFRLGLRRARITANEALIFEGDFSLEAGHRAMTALIASQHRFSGVCCSNDEMAIGALCALQAADIAVPDQVSVIGFDNLRFGAYANPPLTTIEVPTTDSGETAMQLMLDLLRDPTEEGREVILPHRLVVRASSGPAPD